MTYGPTFSWGVTYKWVTRKKKYFFPEGGGYTSKSPFFSEGTGEGFLVKRGGGR